jgi:hypothetical protein
MPEALLTTPRSSTRYLRHYLQLSKLRSLPNIMGVHGRGRNTLITLMTKLCSQEERLNLRTGGKKSSDDKAFFGEIPANQSTLTLSQNLGHGNHRRFQGGRSRSRGRGPPIEGRNSRFTDSNGSSRKRGRCNNCGRPGHWAEECWDDPYDEPYNPS